MFKMESPEVEQNQAQSSAYRYAICTVLNKLFNPCGSKKRKKKPYLTHRSKSLEFCMKTSTKESLNKLSIHSAYPTMGNDTPPQWIIREHTRSIIILISIHILLFLKLKPVLLHRCSRTHIFKHWNVDRYQQKWPSDNPTFCLPIKL